MRFVCRLRTTPTVTSLRILTDDDIARQQTGAPLPLRLFNQEHCPHAFRIREPNREQGDSHGSGSILEMNQCNGCMLIDIEYDNPTIADVIRRARSARK